MNFFTSIYNILYLYLSSTYFKGTRKILPGQFPRWIPSDQIPSNLTLTQTLTLTQVGIHRGGIDQKGNFLDTILKDTYFSMGGSAKHASSLPILFRAYGGNSIYFVL